MKIIITIISLASMILFSTGIVYAKGLLGRIARGVQKIATAPVEIVKGISEDVKEQDPITGIVTGTFKGTARGVGQIGEGTAEVITSPISQDE